MSQKNILYLAHAAIIAAIYIVLTMLAAGFDLASGAVQVRFSEALTVLPFFTPAAIPGLTIGCFLANLFTGCLPPDIIFGTLATFLGAVGTYFLRGRKYLCPLPPIIANTVIVPQVLSRAYHIPGSIPFLMLTVGIGEVIACYILGFLLLRALEPLRMHLFERTA
ncbi:MAG: QueT transporter family protein [Lachnospiraceae bacterium]|nr:QueT transporter family protein [Lachnospiraceae bacterium]